MEVPFREEPISINDTKEIVKKMYLYVIFKKMYQFMVLNDKLIKCLELTIFIFLLKWQKQ